MIFNGSRGIKKDKRGRANDIMKKIYAIKVIYGKLYVEIIPVIKETDKLYYLDRQSSLRTVRYVSQLRKAEEGETWTTNETDFKKIAQKYIDDTLSFEMKRIVNEQNKFENLKQQVKAKGLEVNL